MLLQRGVSHESHMRVVHQAGELLEGSALARYILPFSENHQLHGLLPQLVRRGQWCVVGQLLSRGVGEEEERRRAVEEALRRASDSQVSVLRVTCSAFVLLTFRS